MIQNLENIFTIPLKLVMLWKQNTIKHIVKPEFNYLETT